MIHYGKAYEKRRAYPAGKAAKPSAAAGRTVPKAAAAPASGAASQPKAPADDGTFDRRLARHYDEMKWLYCELYHGDEAAFDYFTGMLRRCYDGRKAALRAQDAAREADPNWYRRSDLLGMMLYTGAMTSAGSRGRASAGYGIPNSRAQCAGDGSTLRRYSRSCAPTGWMR